MNVNHARLASTSQAWVRRTFLEMNLVALAKFLLAKIQIRLLQHGCKSTKI